jgi:hypothetical protein
VGWGEKGKAEAEEQWQAGHVRMKSWSAGCVKFCGGGWALGICTVSCEGGNTKPCKSGCDFVFRLWDVRVRWWKSSPFAYEYYF